MLLTRLSCALNPFLLVVHHMTFECTLKAQREGTGSSAAQPYDDHAAYRTIIE